MYLFLSIFIFLLVSQIFMGIFATKVKRGLKKKYSYYVGEQVEFNRILEYYQSKNDNLKILASNEIDNVCIAEEDLIIINKKSIYAKDLYSNLYLIFQLQLTKPRYKDLRNIYNYQSIVFFFQMLSLVLFFVFSTISEIILLVGFILFLLNVFILLYGIYNYGIVLKAVFSEAVNYLKLDKVEQARAESLINEIKYEILTYPLEIPWRLSRFWSL